MASRIVNHLTLLAILSNSPVWAAAESWEKDFANSLLAGLTPLLGLFGERFALQYLSESFTFQDRILFAMAPLGILAAIVGAIRVGGASWLKRVIGRARENNADVEMELLSSVSQEVCELWNGRSIIRSTGQPEVKQIIHIPAEQGDISPESFITMNPETWSKNYKLKKRNSIAKGTGSKKSFDKSPPISPEQHSEKSTVTGRSNEGDDNVDPESQLPEDTAGLEAYKDMPPNISLNIHGGSNSIKLWNYAIIATALQIAVLIWSGYLAYSSFAHRYKILTGLKPTVGFPLQAVGTVLLTLGLVLCAGIIDNGSSERHWSRERESQIGTLTKDQSSKEKELNRRDMQLYWIQREHTVGGNNIDSHILYAKELKDEIFESHYSQRPEEKSQNDRDDKSLYRKLLLLPLKKFLGFFRRHQTDFAVLFGVLGFVAQFQGLRFSNWTCSMAQLIALGVATFLRVWVRRGMTKTPVAIPVNKNYILDYLTLAIVGNELSDFKFSNERVFRSPWLFFAFGVTSAPKLRAITKSAFNNPVQPRSINSNKKNSEFANSRLQSASNPQLSAKVGGRLNLAQQALNLRVRLGLITKWTGSNSQEAIILSNSIEIALERLNPGRLADFGEKCAVVLPIDIRNVRPTSMPSSREEVELYITKDGEKWKVDDAQLEALLSLVSYSAWATKQKIGIQEEKSGSEDMMYLKSSGYCTKKQNIENNRPTGWLRAKPPDLRIYNKIVGKVNPKLLSDLYWWIPDMERLHNHQKVKMIDKFKEKETWATSVPSSSSFLGLYVDDKASKENDTFWFLECAERQAFVLHLFSSFIWVGAEHIFPNGTGLEPAKVTATYKLHNRHHFPETRFFEFSEKTSPDQAYLRLHLSDPRVPQLKSDRLEALVQELQSLGLGTSEEIYVVLIPPLSHFDRLPTATLVEWCFERVTTLKNGKPHHWPHALDICVELFTAVQYRGVVDDFAIHAAARVAEFLLQVTDPENPKRLTPEEEVEYFEKVSGCIKNENLFKAPIQEFMAGNDRRKSVLEKLGFR